MGNKVKIHGPDWGLLPHRMALRDEFKPSQLNPASNGNPDFDWESVFAHLDGDVTDDAETKQAAAKMTARVMAELVAWALEVNLQDHRALKAIGVRLVAMAWVINPKQFGDSSLATISKSLGFKGANSISPSAAEFSRRFGLTNKFQDHDWRKKH
jgi:hypothetical protein